MLPLWAVAYVDYYDNEILIEFVHSPDFRQAVCQHSKVGGIEEIPSDILTDEAVREFFWNGDILIEAKEVP